VTQAADGRFVALARNQEALTDDCDRAALIVTVRQAPQGCAASVITSEPLHRHGAMALRRGRNGFTIDAVKPAGIDRPWSPAVAVDGEPASAPLVAAPRNQDATPSESDLQSED
jgi:competence protein ComEC